MKTPPDDLFTKMFISIMTVLVAAGVVGVWSMSTTLARLETRVDTWIASSTVRFDDLKKNNDEIGRELRIQDRRISTIEGRK